VGQLVSFHVSLKPAFSNVDPGTGLFVGSGGTLSRGGPLFILLGYIILSVLVLFIVTAITEVAAYLPVSGGTMSYYGHRNVSNSLGFAMGWLYFYSLGILVPYEITAAGLVIDYWNSPINIAVWITIFIVVIVGLNILPVQFYGETEFWFASLKVFMMIGLLILSFILFWGGGRKLIPQSPTNLNLCPDTRISTATWHSWLPLLERSWCDQSLASAWRHRKIHRLR
jgi:amino acid permease